jgi:hypothetical protein
MAKKAFPWCNIQSTKAVRIASLVKNLTNDEKVDLVWSLSIGSTSKPISRINWPEVHWWHEDIHGVWIPGDKNVFTSWPQPIGVAASYNTSLFAALGRITSTGSIDISYTTVAPRVHSPLVSPYVNRRKSAGGDAGGHVGAEH